jgi:hypothetical protein
MVQLPASFNPSAPGQEGVGDWTPLPVGDYQAHVKKSEMVATKDNPNHFFLQLDWEILAGESAGKIMTQRLNLVNSNPVAVEIAQKHLKSICDAMAIAGPIGDSVVLHNKPIVISVIHTKPTANYGAGNDIKKYEAIGGAAAVAVAGAAVGAVGVPTPTPPAAPVGAPAWSGAAAATPTAPVADPAAAPIPTPAPVPDEKTEEAPTASKPPWVK